MVFNALKNIDLSKFATKTVVIFLLMSSHIFYAQRIESLVVNIKEAIKTDNDSLLLKNVNMLYASDTILPDESAYYLGYTLLRFSEFKSSKRALLRYVDLTKESGVYLDSTINILNRIDTLLGQYAHDNCGICRILGPLEEVDTCNVCAGGGILVKDCHRCQGVGREVCPVCRGSGFQTQQTQFFVNYVTCRTCNGVGQVECSSCQGTKTEKSACESCSGIGLKNKARVCTHRDFDIPESKTEKIDNSFSR